LCKHGAYRIAADSGRGGEGEAGRQGPQDMDGRALIGEGVRDQGSYKDDNQAGEGGNVVPHKVRSGTEALVRGGETTLEVLDNYQDQERRPTEGERSEI